MRRCGIEKGRLPKYGIAEIQALVGGTPRRIGRSLTVLGRLGLVSWSESAVDFSEAMEFAPEKDLSEVLDLVPNHGRLVPVPRRIIRFIAGGQRKVVIATILGHLLRCLYYKGGLCLPEGTCKASWVADVFGVDVRNVKSARKELLAIGWLLPIATKQVHLNRFGARFRVNLEWPSRNDISPLPKRSLPPPKTTTGSPPPYKNKKLSTRSEKPETRRSGPAGVFQKPGAEKAKLRNVRMEDLDSAPKLCELFTQAVEEGLVRRSDMDRLNFFAAAEHARAVGTRNPCGLFVAIVRRGLWRYITLSDEDAARRKMRDLVEAGVFRHQRATRLAKAAAPTEVNGRGSFPEREWWRDEVPDAHRSEIRAAVLKSLRPAAESDNRVLAA